MIRKPPRHPPEDAAGTALAPADPPFAKVCTVYRLRMATRRATRLYDRHLAPAGLGIAQFGLLNAIAWREGASVTDIAALLDMDRTTLTRNLVPLMRRGLVSLGPGGDRRTRAVTITPAGREAVRQAAPAWRAAQDELAASLGSSGHAALLAAIDLALEHIPDPDQPPAGRPQQD